MSDLNKKLMNTPDLNKERLDILKKHLPDLFTADNQLNESELRKLIDIDYKESERFDFRWFGKTKAKRLAFTPTNKTLAYDQKRSISPDLADGNLIIEGENLESLKVLLAAYREKIKCIYIDPPYNTGNDLIYKDNFNINYAEYKQNIGDTDGEGLNLNSNPDTSGHFHSDWLNMIYSRLLLSRQLLRDDGVIFISIDDNEVHNLRKVCDEIFGKNNFIAQFVVDSAPAGTQSALYVAQQHSYCLMYKKKDFQIRRLKLSDEELKDKYPEKDSLGYFAISRLWKRGQGGRKEDQPSLHFPVYYCPQEQEIYFEKEVNNATNLIKIIPYQTEGVLGRWTWSQDSMLKHRDKLIARKTNGEYKLYRKKYIFEEENSLPKSIIGSSLGRTELGSLEVKNLFGFKAFTYPKPVPLIRLFLEISSCGNDIILDFFAGSGTTGEAVMRLNAEDKCKRKFILIQANESTDKNSEAYQQGYVYISDICIERNKRALAQLQSDDSGFQVGFEVYKLADSQFARKNFNPNPNKSEEENLKMLKEYVKKYEQQVALSVDPSKLFDEILLKQGFVLNYKKEQLEIFKANQVFKIKDSFKECLICLDAEINQSTIKTLEDKFGDSNFICLDYSLDTNLKWDLDRIFKNRFITF